MTEALADRVIERHRKRPHGRARRITIDLDLTDTILHIGVEMRCSAFRPHARPARVRLFQ